MKTKKSVLALFLALSMLCCISVVVSASDPPYTRYSTISVSAGGSSFTTQLSYTSTTRSQCYMRLRSFQFSNHSENYLPDGKYIYSRLYTQTHNMASNYATFSGPTAQGHYNYSYLSGYGGSGQPYCLKTNSDWNVAYEAKFDWSSNPY